MKKLNHVGKTMSFLPPMTGHGFYIPPIKMLMTGDGKHDIVVPT
jgi:hypothetical protein